MQKYYKWNPCPSICENSKYLKSIADTSVTECDKIITIIDDVSTKRQILYIYTALMNCHSKKARDCYILHTVLLVIILLFIITTISYHYAKQKGII